MRQILVIMEHLIPLVHSKNRPGEKVLIFGSGRSGSTVLQQILSPDDRCHDLGEILRRRRKRPATIGLFSRIFRRLGHYNYVNGHANYQLKKGDAQVCAHVKPMHVGQEGIKSFLGCAKNDGWKVILLFRKPSELIISAEKAKVTKLWHTKTKFCDMPTMTERANGKRLFPKNVLSRMMRGTSTRWKYNEQMRAWLNQNPGIICDYNMDLASTQKQSDFTKRLKQMHPAVEAQTATIGLTRNASYPYSPEDLEAIKDLEKFELEIFGDYNKFYHSLEQIAS